MRDSLSDRELVYHTTVVILMEEFVDSNTAKSGEIGKPADFDLIAVSMKSKGGKQRRIFYCTVRSSG